MLEGLAPELLLQPPVWGGIVARRHNDTECVSAMETWFANVLRYSRRDQLSLSLALLSLPDSSRHILVGDNHQGEFFYWPTSRDKPARYFEHNEKVV